MEQHPSNQGHLDLVLTKKSADGKEAEWWPRLTADKAKLHFLKASDTLAAAHSLIENCTLQVNFDKWVDEDEDDGGGGGDGREFDIQQMLANMGGGGGGGMPDYSNMPQWDADDSDNEGVVKRAIVQYNHSRLQICPSSRIPKRRRPTRRRRRRRWRPEVRKRSFVPSCVLTLTLLEYPLVVIPLSESLICITRSNELGILQFVTSHEREDVGRYRA